MTKTLQSLYVIFLSARLAQQGGHHDEIKYMRPQPNPSFNQKNHSGKNPSRAIKPEKNGNSRLGFSLY